MFAARMCVQSLRRAGVGGYSSRVAPNTPDIPPPAPALFQQVSRTVQRRAGRVKLPLPDVAAERQVAEHQRACLLAVVQQYVVAAAPSRRPDASHTS